jgi:hypothetical protein
VINTHVHGISSSESTHWPLNAKGVPVERFVPLLRSSGHRGLFVLELNPLKFQTCGPVVPLIEGSLERLRRPLVPDQMIPDPDKWGKCT